jgi:hypothetical protein
MKTGKLAIGAIIVLSVATIGLWIGPATSPVQGDTSDASGQGDQLTRLLQTRNDNLQKLNNTVQGGNVLIPMPVAKIDGVPAELILVQLPDDVNRIFNKYLEPNGQKEVQGGELTRDKFSADELEKLDKFIKERSQLSDDAQFDRATASYCGACSTGASKGYLIYIPSAGIFACASCYVP